MPKGQKVKRVLLVVAYRELVDRYVSACRKAGINLAGIDLEAFALLRALGAPADREGSALVAVAIGHDRSTFAVSDGRVCEFTRVVEWGGSALNVALARAFDSTPSEVETMKRGLSLDGSTTPEDLTPEQTTVALDAVRRQLQSFARELVSSLQFYQNQPGSLGIGEIVLTGGTAHLPVLRRSSSASSAFTCASVIPSHVSRSPSALRAPSRSVRSPLQSDSGSRTDARRQPSPARIPEREEHPA